MKAGLSLVCLLVCSRELQRWARGCRLFPASRSLARVVKARTRAETLSRVSSGSLERVVKAQVRVESFSVACILLVSSRTRAETLSRVSSGFLARVGKAHARMETFPRVSPC